MRTDTIQVDRLIFSGSGPHEKLFADGNVIAEGKDVLLDRAIGVSVGTGVRSVRQAVVRVDSASTRAVLYWYSVGNSATGIPLTGRFLQVGSALTRGVSPELIVVSKPCGNDCNLAFASLNELVLGIRAAPSRKAQ